MGTQIYKTIFFDLGLTLVGEDSTRWNEGAQTLLAQLRAANVRLGVISNTGDLTRPQLTDRLPDTFDWTVFEPSLILLSSEIGIRKPDIRIFQLAVERSGVEARQCLFCSDDLLETLAAQRVGMNAARLIPPPATELVTFLERLEQLSAT